MDKDHGKEFVEYIKLICQEFSEFALMNKMYQISCVIDFDGFSLTEIASRDGKCVTSIPMPCNYVDSFVYLSKTIFVHISQNVFLAREMQFYFLIILQ